MKFLKTIVKHTKKNTIIHTFTWETCKSYKNYSKIHEKVYKFPLFTQEPCKCLTKYMETIQISIEILKKHTNI